MFIECEYLGSGIECNTYLNDCEKCSFKHPEIKKVDDYYMVENQNFEMRIPKDSDMPRDILLIPNIELANGIYKVIELNVGINKEGLFKTIANLLGFTRMGDNIRLKLEQALSYELSLGKIRKENDEYFIK